MVNPKIWGDGGWTFLYSVVADYPDNPGIDMQYHYKIFFFYLRWVLPCEVCRENYDLHYRKWPIDQYLKSRDALSQWLTHIYNETRKDAGKKPLTREEIVRRHFGNAADEMIFLLCGPRPGSFVPTLEQVGGGSLQVPAPVPGSLGSDTQSSSLTTFSPDGWEYAIGFLVLAALAYAIWRRR